jgi:hypothetical protein
VRNASSVVYLFYFLMLLHLAIVLGLLGLGMAYSARASKLTIPAVWVGGGLGLSIYLGAGFVGLALLALFFGLGTPPRPGEWPTSAALAWPKPTKAAARPARWWPMLA